MFDLFDVFLMDVCFPLQLLPVVVAGGCCGLEDQADLLGLETTGGTSTFSIHTRWNESPKGSSVSSASY